MATQGVGILLYSLVLKIAGIGVVPTLGIDRELEKKYLNWIRNLKKLKIPRVGS
tara:strand:+ start:6600 stop:6761 length:162 start_codon:yes stop_codon:yes gene_type:complete